ncbi:MAG: PxKF domain-containing protein [Gaiellaceae bacterium]
MRITARWLRTGMIATAVVVLLAAAAPFGSGPVAQAAGGSLTGQIIYSAANSATPPVQADLTAAGNEDWAIWGTAIAGSGGVASTSLMPDVRKAGGSAITALTDIEGSPPIAIRGLGVFTAESPFLFNWTDGSLVAPSATSAGGGIQHNANGVSSAGYGFSFTVPATTAVQRLTVWVHAHGGEGKLTAALSDGSAPTFTDTSVGNGGHNAPGVYQLDFASASPGKTLTVTWTLDHVVGLLTGGNSSTNNAAVYAAALSSTTTLSTPTIVRAVSSGTAVALTGRIEGGAGVPVTLSVKSSPTCANGALGGIPATLGALTVTPGADSYFNTLVPVSVPLRSFVTVSATAPTSTSDSQCAVVAGDNDSWPHAFPLDTTGGTSQDVIDSPGQARWYSVDVLPGSRLTVDLTNLPANYDLAVFKDIGQAYTSLTSTQNLTHLSAEFAPSAFSPSAFSPSAFSPSAFSPDAYSPSAFSPSAFSPSAFSPSAFSPSAFSPSAFSPSAFSPSAFSPSAFSPSAFSPSAFSPSAFSPSAFSPDAFASAQTRSLVAVSATPGTADERIVANTWTNTGRYYIRVSGSNGASSTGDPFRVTATKSGTSCAGVAPIGSAPTFEPAGAYKTIILTDYSRLPGTAAEKLALQGNLETWRLRPEIAGAPVVNVADDPRLSALAAQASLDANVSCPYAKNLLGNALKDVVDAYRTSNPGLKYVVIVGNDGVIPFFRYPDETLLGQESGYDPPVGPATASEASLSLDYVLGQDAYGAHDQISLRSTSFPVPDLAVGRLVETASEASGMLDAYTAANGSVTPHSSLVTGYDFLADAADSVKTDLAEGTAQTPDTLITPNDVSPQDPRSWTAAQLKTSLLGSRHDLVFLAGHFSANSALAADFSTSLLTTDVASSATDFTNSIVFSAGCHSGYNIVDSDGISGLTQPLDWAQTFARKRATLIAGTGYQYGDTDFIEYSERIYANFAKQLRTGLGVIPVGAALVRAKQQYLAATPDIRGLHEKALLEATLFGLPMLGVNMPGNRLTPPGAGSVVTTLTPFQTKPGAALGLSSFDLPVTPSLSPKTVALANIAGGTVTATYYRGGAGVVANPAEPALPLESLDVTPPDSSVVLRGVGFRGGTYTDSSVIPLTGAPTTELRGVHAPFVSPVFYPMRLSTPSYFAALGGGATTLLVTPAQHKTLSLADGTSTLRLYDGLSLRLFYSGYLGASALSAAPDVVDVHAVANGSGGVDIRAHVVGNPAAGIQQTWITYTGDGPSRWASLDLTRDASDSTLWTGTLPSIASPDALRFVVQAVNGVGLVTLDDNLGSYYRVGTVATAAPAATTLTLQSAPSNGIFGGDAAVTAALSSASGPLAGRNLTVSVGGSTRVVTTGADGTATATVPLISLPGQTTVNASFGGDDSFLPSSASAPFTLAKAPSSLSAFSQQFGVVTGEGDTGMTTTLTAALGLKTQPLLQQTVTFVVSGPAGSKTFSTITDYLGRATLPSTGLPAGTYTVTATFRGDATYTNTSRTGSLVVSAFTGFFQPVDNPPTLNTVTSGRAIPVKFSLGGNRGLAIFAPGYPAVATISCASGAPTDAIETTVTADASGLLYDATSAQYNYVWKTVKGWTGCRELQLKLVDGSIRTARFKFS